MTLMSGAGGSVASRLTGLKNVELYPESTAYRDQRVYENGVGIEEVMTMRIV